MAGGRWLVRRRPLLALAIIGLLVVVGVVAVPRLSAALRPARHPGGHVGHLGHAMRATVPPAVAPTKAPTEPPTPTRGSGAKPNIVEFLMDDMRVDDLAYMPTVRKELAGHGVTFENGFSSYPLCCPARASFLSGQLPHNHHVWSVDAPYAYPSFDDSRTLATSLKAAGYHTGFTGKYLNAYGGPEPVKGGWTMAWQDGRWRKVRNTGLIPSARKIPDGWDDWRGFIEWNDATTSLDGSPVHGGTYHYFDVAESVNGDPRADWDGEFSSTVAADDADQMIDEFTGSRKPFFLSVNFVAPHVGSGDAAEDARDAARGVPSDKLLTAASPADVHGRFDSVITHGAGVLPGGATESDADGDGRDTVADTRDKPGRFGSLPALTPDRLAATTEDSRQRAEAVYATDREIARVLRKLKRTGEWNNTVVLFWSDNGYLQGEHHRANGKILAYNPSERVPVIVTGPGMRAPRNSYDPISVVDLTATLLDLAGATPPHPSDGHSLADVLTGGDRGWTVPVPYEEGWLMPGPASARHRDPTFPEIVRRPHHFVTTYHPDGRVGQGVRTAQYSYVRYADGAEELYDEWADPLEMSNVAEDPAYAAVKRQLHRIADDIYDCRGRACTALLPASLRADPATVAEHTRDYWDTVYATYGNRMQRRYWHHQRAVPAG